MRITVGIVVIADDLAGTGNNGQYAVVSDAVTALSV